MLLVEMVAIVLIMVGLALNTFGNTIMKRVKGRSESEGNAQ